MSPSEEAEGLGLPIEWLDYNEEELDSTKKSEGRERMRHCLVLGIPKYES